jgi:Gas vesicle synthesis protein GvpL/GvpF
MFSAMIGRKRKPPLLLHGVTHAGVADVIGSAGAEFAGMRVWPVVEGTVAGLVSWSQMAPPWWLWWRRARANPDVSPVLSALATVFPIVPTLAGTVFVSEEPLRAMLAAREPELDEIVLRHSAFLQCNVDANFDTALAVEDVTVRSPVGELRASTESEFELVRRTLEQSVNGRQAVFLARLRRCLADVAADIAGGRSEAGPSGFSASILLARSSRAAFRLALEQIGDEAGVGALIRLGPFLPPISFRRIEVQGANVGQVNAARLALGLDDSSDRSGIRVAYRRTLERLAPGAGTSARTNVAQLESQFGLLDLIAEGQIKAARGGPDTQVRFDAQSLSKTWLLKLHAHEVAERVA